jgi:MSHA biogenesis protein MshP
MKKLQKGFSIVSAIFLLVVLAFLGTAMVTFSTSQQQSAAMDVMGARAYQAARAGVEWGAYQVLPNSAVGFAAACRAGPASTTLAAGTLAGTLRGFSVEVDCISASASEVNAATGTVWVYDLVSTATQGAAGQPDYVERQIQVSIAQ